MRRHHRPMWFFVQHHIIYYCYRKTIIKTCLHVWLNVLNGCRSHILRGVCCTFFSTGGKTFSFLFRKIVRNSLILYSLSSTPTGQPAEYVTPIHSDERLNFFQNCKNDLQMKSTWWESRVEKEKHNQLTII